MKKNILNQKFNLLTVDQFLGSFPVGHQGVTRGKWLCTCDCGNTHEVYTGDLISGKTKSCGCMGKIKNGKKECTRCKTFLPFESFYTKASACKECSKKRKKELYDPKITSERYYRNLTEEQIKKRRLYARNKRAEDPIAANNRVKLWRQANPNYAKNRWKNDIKYRLLNIVRSRVYKAIKGHTKAEKTKILLGCTVEELKTYLAGLFTEGMSWDNYGEWHIDHIKPCSLFDMSDMDQQKECFNYKNLQPLWKEDNLKKSNKYG